MWLMVGSALIKYFKNCCLFFGFGSGSIFFVISKTCLKFLQQFFPYKDAAEG
jgi:hypothetical protein